jgi:hypothetical protein
MTKLDIINNSIIQTINENSIENLQRASISHEEAVYMVTEYCDLDSLVGSLNNSSEIF